MTKLKKHGAIIEVTNGAAAMFTKQGWEPVGASGAEPVVIPVARPAGPAKGYDIKKPLAEWGQQELLAYVNTNGIADGKNQVLHLKKLVKEHMGLK